ncbi:MAG: asparagine synthase (glutamine-hydrolyzing) [Ferruginibacter sp.]
MCGISGIISLQTLLINKERLVMMADALQHRGPDGKSTWINSNGTVGFGHNRLAIIDLTAAAAQPMHYMHRYTIVYNGEIYNYIELKAELQKAGYAFNNRSDTEVILAAYDCYKEKCLQYFDGMFSFAIWDENEQTLFAARDRFGEKPFYYYTDKNKFAFASEMKALWAAGIVQKNLEPKMMLNYLSLGYVQNASDKSQTFFSDIYALPPSHYMHFNLHSGTLNIASYWDLDKQATIKISEKAAVEKMHDLFSRSVIARLRSDVPVGCSLSGGLDSSSIAWYISQMQNAKKSGSLKSFSAVFPGFVHDESVHVKLISDTLHINSNTCSPSADEMICDFEKLMYHQEEPFQSSSVFAQYKVFELARKNNVTVLLDGQGADEILGGYPKYIHWYLQELVSRNKFSKFKKERAALQKNNLAVRWNIKNIAAAFLPSHASIALEKNEFNKIIYNHEVSKELRASLKGREWDGIHKPVVTKLNDILYFNVMENGLEELLRFADRNSMAHGCEVRLPYLNAALVQFIFSLPSQYKITDGYNKWIWRKMMDTRLPANIVWRKDKVGFETPQKKWMQKDGMIDLVHESRKKLIQERILKPQVQHKKILALDANDTDNFDWRYICAAQML